MARLVNNKGNFYIEINKDSQTEISLIAIHGGLIQLQEETKNSYLFEILENGYDGASPTWEHEYRSVLEKITNNPEPEIVIPRDPYISIAPGSFGNMPEIYRTLTEQYPKQNDINFLAEVGNKEILNTTFRWNEDNKLEKESE